MLEKVEFRTNGVVVKLHGIVTSQEILDANYQLLRRLEEAPYRYQLWCFSDVEDMQISAGEIRQIAMKDVAAAKEYPLVKVAIASNSPLVFGLGRMYAAYTDGGAWETSVFYSIDAAEAWIRGQEAPET